MKTARRSVRLLLAALPLFAAGLATGLSGASARAQARPAPESLGVSIPAPAQPAPSPAPTPQADRPALQTDRPAAASAPTPEQACWNLLLVNGDKPLPEDFQVPELTRLRNGRSIDSRAYPALQAMLDGARAEGLQPLVCSAYRAWDIQERLFEQEVQNWLDRGYIREEAEARAALWVARPGASEHQTGLAVDIVDLSYQVLDGGQEDTPVQRWLMEHCWEYGFILRYPAGKSALTGISYEPWHYRYVGLEAAREMAARALCLEEYLG